LLCALLCAVVCALLSVAAPPALHAQRGGSKKPPGPPPLPDLPKVPSTQTGLFAERDRRAAEALGYVRCVERTVGAVRAGLVGTIASTWELACVNTGREWRGVYGEITAGMPGAAVRVQVAARGAAGAAVRGVAVVTDEVDTTLVGAVLRAQRRGASVPLRGRDVTPFVPVVLPQENIMEVWFLPLPGTAGRVAVGGDSVIQMAKDGSRELGHSRSSPAIRFVTAPAANARTLTIASVEERIPLVSELFAARELLTQVPEVRVRTRQFESVLTRARGTWVHTALPGATP